MKHFRSLLLSSMPLAAVPDRRNIVPRRFRIVGICALCILVPIFLVWLRLIPKVWPFRFLYLVHDHIFLPFKGYLYTLFYPYSLTWWGPILVVFVSWLLCYLAMVAPVKGLHIFFLRKAIHKKGLRKLLVGTARWLKKWKMKPVLLLELTNQERAIAINRLVQMPLEEVNMGSIKSLVHLTGLHVDLLTLPPQEPKELLNAAVYWHQAYLQLRVRCRGSKAVKNLETLIQELADKLHPIAGSLLDWKEHEEKERFDGVKEKKPGFDPITVTVDLLYLACLSSGKLAKMLLGSEIALQQEKIHNQVTLRLAHSVAARRAILDEARNELELYLAPVGVTDADTNGENPGNQERKASLYTMSGDFNLLSAIGRLSLSIALDLSALVHSADIGLGFLESMEMLDFQLSCTERRTMHPAAAQLLSQSPVPSDYRLCAELARWEVEQFKKAWQKSVLREGPIKKGDIEVAVSRVHSLFRTAGPDFDLTRKEENP